MLRWHPTCHNQKDPQLKHTTMYWGDLGRRKKNAGGKKRKEDGQQLAQVPIFKKKRRNTGFLGPLCIKIYPQDFNLKRWLKVNMEKLKPSKKNWWFTFLASGGPLRATWQSAMLSQGQEKQWESTARNFFFCEEDHTCANICCQSSSFCWGRLTLC